MHCIVMYAIAVYS